MNNNIAFKKVKQPKKIIEIDTVGNWWDSSFMACGGWMEVEFMPCLMGWAYDE